MQKYFTGSFEHKVDPKGRVSLPAEYRKILQDAESAHFVLIPQYHRPESHDGFSQAAYENLIARYEAMEFGNEADDEAVRMLLIGRARTIMIDDAGRFVLSDDLRKQINVTSDMMFVGNGSFFQLWEPGARAAVEAAQADRGRALLQRLPTKGLL